jgi:hypothetical protein
MEIELLKAGQGCRLGAAGPLLVMVFDGEPGPDLLDLIEAEQRKHLERNAKMVGITVIAMEKLEAPSAEFRARAARLREVTTGRIHSSAMVVLTRGLVSVIVRTFLAGYQLLVQREHPEGNFKDIPSAVAWLQNVQGQLPEVKQLQGLAEAVEAFVRRKNETRSG